MGGKDRTLPLAFRAREEQKKGWLSRAGPCGLASDWKRLEEHEERSLWLRFAHFFGRCASVVKILMTLICGCCVIAAAARVVARVMASTAASVVSAPWPIALVE